MYKRSIHGWAKHWDFIILDTVCLQISFILAYFIRYGEMFPYNERNAYRTVGFVMILLSVAVAILFNTMHNVLRRGVWLEIRNTVWQCALVFAGVVILLYSDKSSNRVSRIVLYVTIGIYFALAIITRMLYKRILIAHKRGNPRREILLVGDEKGIKQAQAAFRAHPEEGINVKTVVRVDGNSEVSMSDAADYIRNEWIDEVYVACSDIKQVPLELLKVCSEMAVTVHRQMLLLEDEANEHLWIGKIAKQPVLTTSSNIPEVSEMVAKRWLDIFSGLVLSVLAVIVLVISTPFIKLSSPGPVLLSFDRIGQNGRKFKLHMIRTMYMDAANREDKFIRGIGVFLHRWSLDRLPMGFNVLAGSMSLVGTRAPSPEEWERYKYHHRARLACKPGITGLFQVCAGGKNLSFEKATKIDTYYITNWTPGLDLRIMFTPAVVKARYEKRMADKQGVE